MLTCPNCLHTLRQPRQSQCVTGRCANEARNFGVTTSSQVQATTTENETWSGSCGVTTESQPGTNLVLNLSGLDRTTHRQTDSVQLMVPNSGSVSTTVKCTSSPPSPQIGDGGFSVEVTTRLTIPPTDHSLESVRSQHHYSGGGLIQTDSASMCSEQSYDTVDNIEDSSNLLQFSVGNSGRLCPPSLTVTTISSPVMMSTGLNSFSSITLPAAVQTEPASFSSISQSTVQPHQGCFSGTNHIPAAQPQQGCFSSVSHSAIQPEQTSFSNLSQTAVLPQQTISITNQPSLQTQAHSFSIFGQKESPQSFTLIYPTSNFSNSASPVTSPCCTGGQAGPFANFQSTNKPANPHNNVSPSAPLSFLLPQAGQQSHSVFIIPPSNSASSPTSSSPSSPAPTISNPTEKLLNKMDLSSTDMTRILSTVSALRTSGWYYQGLTWQQSIQLLENTDIGTFLVRESSDPNFLFSLSVQTEKGPTSVRIHYVNSQFRLDAVGKLVQLMPVFDCVVALIDYYVMISDTVTEKGQVLVDSIGKVYSPIQLKKPLYRQMPKLQHMCRLVINRRVPNHRTNELRLPRSLLNYFGEYPFKH